MNSYTCPVCSYEKMTDPPSDYNICPQCGTEFGYSDESFTHAELREQWIAGESKFWFKGGDRDE